MEIVSCPIFIFILYITSWLIFSPIILFIEFFSKEQLFIKYITPLFFIKEKKVKYIYHYIDDVINHLKEIKLDYYDHRDAFYKYFNENFSSPYYPILATSKLVGWYFIFGFIILFINELTHKQFILNYSPFLYLVMVLFMVGYLKIKFTQIIDIVSNIKTTKIYFTEEKQNLYGQNTFELDYLNKLTEDDYTQKIIGEPFLCRYTKDFLFFLSQSYNDLDYIKSIINKYHSTLIKLTKHYDNPNYLQINYFDTNSNLFNKEYLLYYVFSHTKSEYKELMNPVFNTLYSNGVHETWKFSPFNGQNYSEDLNYMKELSILNENNQIKESFSNSSNKSTIKRRL